MLSDADTIGVFQVESRAQMSMLPRLKPNNFYDLVIEVAIVRPGPIQGNMVHPYLRRRAGLEPVSFPSKELEQVLAKTLGVPLFQEQAMRIAMVAAGFSADEADKLRRAMAAWRRSTAIEAFHDKIIRGMIANGYDPAFAAQCFDQIKGFGEYGFPESHAASFALLVYVSAWLKRYHPAAFCAALLNSQPMGFYMPAQIVRDAKEHGVEVREADVNESEWDCLLEGRDKGERHEGTEARRYEGKGRGKGRRDGGTKGRRDEGTEGRRDGGTEGKGRDGGTEGRRVGGVTSSSSPSPGTPGEGWGEGNIWAGASGVDARNVPKELWGIGGPAVRLGFREIKGFREAHARQIVQARAAGRFISVADFHQRTRLPVAALRVLAEADAFGSIGLSRRQALWEVLPLKDDSELCFRPPPAKTSTGGRAARANSQGGLFDMIDPRTGHPPEAAEPKVALPAMPLGQEVMTDYATIGLSLKQHPVALVRDELKRRKIITADQLTNLPHGRWVKVAGLVLLRQRPGTASGVVFETLEDETGIINLIVKPDIYDRFRPAARHAGLLQADGYLQRQDKVIHVLPKRLFDLSDLLRGYELRSRDFH